MQAIRLGYRKLKHLQFYKSGLLVGLDTALLQYSYKQLLALVSFNYEITIKTYFFKHFMTAITIAQNIT